MAPGSEFTCSWKDAASQAFLGTWGEAMSCWTTGWLSGKRQEQWGARHGYWTLEAPFFTAGRAQISIWTELCPFLHLFPLSGTRAPGYGGIMRVTAEGCERCDGAMYSTKRSPHLQGLGDTKDNCQQWQCTHRATDSFQRQGMLRGTDLLTLSWVLNSQGGSAHLWPAPGQTPQMSLQVTSVRSAHLRVGGQQAEPPGMSLPVCLQGKSGHWMPVCGRQIKLLEDCPHFLK